jgi:hypothetical protein
MTNPVAEKLLAAAADSELSRDDVLLMIDSPQWDAVA